MMRKSRLFSGLLMLVMSQVGCGGGSGDSAAPPAPPPVQQPPSGPRVPLPDFAANQQLPFIQSFLRLAGTVRYHYPGDAAAATDWDAFLTESIYRIGTAANAAEAERLIWQQLSSIAPDLTINQFNGQRVALTNNTQVRAHRQSGYADPTEQGLVYRRTRQDLLYSALSSAPELPQTAIYSYADGLLRADIPLLVAVQNNQTQPQGRAFTNSASYVLPDNMNHVAVCLSVAGQLWSLIDHFYPYFDQIKTDWNSQLRPMLQSCLEPDRQVFIRQMHLSMTQLQDNHIWLFSPYNFSWLGRFFTPVRFDWIEGKLLAIYKDGTASNHEIAVGDELISVNDRPATELVRELSAYSLRSEHRRMEWAAQFYLLRGVENQQFRVKLRRADGIEYQSQLTATMSGAISQASIDDVFQPKTQTFRWLNNQIAYINLSQLQNHEVPAILEQLANARALLMDLRRYPDSSGAHHLLFPRLTAEPAASLPMFMRFSNHPDFARRYLSPVPQFVQPVSPQLTMPMVVMSSRYSISNNEHVLGYLQSMRIPVLGEATYGINGNITVFHLAGGATRNGLTGYFTGMQVNQHDGSALIGRGIQPDIVVPVTSKGLRERRDVQLEAAQVYLEQRLPRP